MPLMKMDRCIAAVALCCALGIGAFTQSNGPAFFARENRIRKHERKPKLASCAHRLAK